MINPSTITPASLPSMPAEDSYGNVVALAQQKWLRIILYENGSVRLRISRQRKGWKVFQRYMVEELGGQPNQMNWVFPSMEEAKRKKIRMPSSD